MAIKRKDENDNLVLTLDNGDREKFDQIMREWSFRDEQAMLRFAMSAMLLTRDRTLGISTAEGDEKIVPKDDAVKQ